ncbi:MAG: NADH-quinone oxidoreductase subunit J [Anaerolineae bacterium]|nr:NADH-quinone oxidoreductase subunit J [Anaerolineae bacterium]MDK1080748.1 NADH-quinone oxidoreductase subunit J [Anaerolineae bacterium]MDK1118073.1 NADH-quinone oxidoreductase subunit J [Anaerolineae bacterium]
MTILFLIIAIVILASAVMVVTTRNLVHAALWLIVSLFGVAVLFAMLNAGFLAVVQVVVYIGAIAILFIFAVMLTRREMRGHGKPLNNNWWISALLSLLTFGGLAMLLSNWDGFSQTPADFPSDFDGVAELGNALIDPNQFVLPFEVASILLVAALVGAVYIASNRK